MSGVKRKAVFVTERATKDIENIVAYLKANWNQKTINIFVSKLEHFFAIVGMNPRILATTIKSVISETM